MGYTFEGELHSSPLFVHLNIVEGTTILSAECCVNRAKSSFKNDVPDLFCVVKMEKRLNFFFILDPKMAVLFPSPLRRN